MNLSTPNPLIPNNFCYNWFFLCLLACIELSNKTAIIYKANAVDGYILLWAHFDRFEFAFFSHYLGSLSYIFFSGVWSFFSAETMAKLVNLYISDINALFPRQIIYAPPLALLINDVFPCVDSQNFYLPLFTSSSYLVFLIYFSLLSFPSADKWVNAGMYMTFLWPLTSSGCTSANFEYLSAVT